MPMRSAFRFGVGTGFGAGVTVVVGGAGVGAGAEVGAEGMVRGGAWGRRRLLKLMIFIVVELKVRRIRDYDTEGI